jgi:hypothetical protein
VLVSQSAEGYYPRSNALVAEDSPPGSGFLSEVVQEWEAEARKAEVLGVRVVTARTGVVLSRAGGALPKMLTPFKLGVGGPVAGGSQPFPWIHVRDSAGALIFLLDNEAATGAVNVVAPDKQTNKTFTKTLGKVIKRPTARWARQSRRARTRTPANLSNLAIGTSTPDSRTHSAASSAEPRLSRWEIVGAWLHVWTPPKGLEVPPVPWRKLAMWGALAALVLGAIAAVAVPRIDERKDEGAAERARQQAAADNAERARLRADQRIHRLTVPVGVAPVAALEAGITADAKQRVAAKTISGPVLSTKCESASVNVIQFPASRVYKCFVTTATGLRGEGSAVLGTGYPFVATIYTKERRLAWCKENPHADEKGSRGDVRVKVSPVCAGKLSHVL